MIKRFPQNTAGKDYVVGDIHGCFGRLQAHLDHIGFNPQVDRLFSVGDLVDRGPESEHCIEWLARPWFHAVQGNHEDMAVWYASGGLDIHMYNMNGGAWMIAKTPAERAEYALILGALPYAMEVETANGLVGIVHAECPFPSWQDFTASLVDPNVSSSMRKAMIEAALWSRERVNAMAVDAVEGVAAVIVGHTPVERMTSLGNTLYIDTGALFRGRDFTILDLATLTPVKLRTPALEWGDA